MMSGLENVIFIGNDDDSLLASKSQILSEMCKEKPFHCLCLQETHRSKDEARLKIPGMALVAEHPHNKHGSSYVSMCAAVT